MHPSACLFYAFKLTALMGAAIIALPFVIYIQENIKPSGILDVNIQPKISETGFNLT